MTVKRWAKNLFCLVLLLVFVGSVVIWVRSYSVREAIVAWSGTTDVTEQPARWRFLEFRVVSACGTVRMVRSRYDYRFGVWGGVSPKRAPLGWEYGRSE